MARFKTFPINPLRRYRKKKVLRKRYEKRRIAVIGSGSWGTAIVKILLNNVDELNWFIRDPNNAEYIKKHRHNPHYLNYLTLDIRNIRFYSDIEEIIEKSSILIFAIPSAFLRELLHGKKFNFSNKLIVSAIKGMIPDENLTITEYFNQVHKISYNNLAIISGPCHAEEIAIEKLSYLTIGARRILSQNRIRNLMQCDYVKINQSLDIVGIEYSAILKNIMAIGAGICHGLGYGDNFLAVYVTNALHEMRIFLDAIRKSKSRKMEQSVYMGDLLVTAYSQFSRNRTLGTMIGKGYSVKSAIFEMNMVAEGYNACRCIHQIKEEMEIETPILNAVYEILYENKQPAEVIRKLTYKLH